MDERNLHTEDEARQLMCPHLSYRGAAKNCVAAKCSQWLWGPGVGDGGNGSNVGYCGLTRER